MVKPTSRVLSARTTIYRIGIIVALLFSLLLGGVILVAWHWQLSPLIQVIPLSPPIRYNTALAFVFSGCALLGVLYRRRWLALIGSLLVALIGGLTLVEYLWQIDLGIDQLLMYDYLTNQPQIDHTIGTFFPEPITQFFIDVRHPLPGRPSPNTAVALMMIGTALVGLVLQTRNRMHLPHLSANQVISAILAAGVLGMSIVALLGYLVEFETPYVWRYLTGVSAPTALGLFALGGGVLCGLQLARNKPQQPRWLPASVGFGVFMASLFLWQTLLSWNHNHVNQLSDATAHTAFFLTSVAHLVLFGGTLLALLCATVVYYGQRVSEQATALQQLNSALAQSNSQLLATLEATADGILVLDARGKRLNFNHRFLAMWNVSQAEVDEILTTSAPSLPAFILNQLRNPEAFLATTHQMMHDLEADTFDVFELRDGRTFERHAKPQWIGDRCVGKVLSYRDVTAQKQVVRFLQESEERYRMVVSSLTEGVVWHDSHGMIQTSNPRAEQILGLTIDQLLGRTSIDPRWRSIREDGSDFPGDQHPAMVSLRTGQPCRNVIMGVHKPSGELTWIAINSQPLFYPGESHPYAVVASFADITEQRRLTEDLFQEKEQAQITLEAIGDGVITTNVHGQIEYLNPVAIALTGWEKTVAKGLPLTKVFQIVNETTYLTVQNPIEIALREQRMVKLADNTLLIAADGREIAISDSAAPIHNRSGQVVGGVLVFQDITAQRNLSRQLTWQAMHDPLTGLVNRREFERRMGQLLDNAQTNDEKHVFCYLDLDQFKVVNDTCGHTAGDELLRQVTKLLYDEIRKTDTLARLGGDEFGVLLHQCTLEQATRLVNILRQKIQVFRFAWNGNQFAVGVSIGVVEINTASDSVAQILVAADTACYSAKNNGRNRVHVYQPDDHEILKQQGEIRWVARLDNALEKNLFCLYAQPIAALNHRFDHEEHVEVLIRLCDQGGSPIAPMAFIPAAERYNLMHKIDQWVIRTLFQNWQALQDRSLSKQTIYAINLSGATLNDDSFIDFIQEQFERYAVPHQQVCFEITETLTVANLTKARHLMTQLQQLGCRFALDDFGSGMSSFGYLKNLPVQYIKIDGGFVKNILHDPIDNAMVEAIIRIGHVMGLKTIAEFVENRYILERLDTLGVDYVQGYEIGKPQPLFNART
jgi:diguanylate cyclase (GGDEF)-like protein/PAS domain S-box-containing protein